MDRRIEFFFYFVDRQLPNVENLWSNAYLFVLECMYSQKLLFPIEKSKYWKPTFNVRQYISLLLTQFDIDGYVDFFAS